MPRTLSVVLSIAVVAAAGLAASAPSVRARTRDRSLAVNPSGKQQPYTASLTRELESSCRYSAWRTGCFSFWIAISGWWSATRVLAMR